MVPARSQRINLSRHVARSHVRSRRSAVRAAVPTHAELFLAFFRITLSGFGGTLPWTRRMFVEQQRWMTAEEFNERLRALPVPARPQHRQPRLRCSARGCAAPTGRDRGLVGFLLVPFCVMLAAGMLYERYGDVEAVRRVLSGIAAAAAGLIIATVAKMAAPMFRRLRTGAVRAAGDGLRDRPDALAAAAGAARAGAGQHRARLVDARARTP